MSVFGSAADHPPSQTSEVTVITHVISAYPDNMAMIRGEPLFQRKVHDTESLDAVHATITENFRVPFPFGCVGVRSTPEYIATFLNRAKAV